MRELEIFEKWLKDNDAYLVWTIPSRPEAPHPEIRNYMINGISCLTVMGATWVNVFVNLGQSANCETMTEQLIEVSGEIGCKTPE